MVRCQPCFELTPQNDLYSTFASQLADGNIDLLAEVHAVSSGLKAYVTTRVVDGCEVARRSMVRRRSKR